MVDPAEIGVMRIGYFRIGVFTDEWDRLRARFEKVCSLDVTRRRLQLGSRDSTTGWYAKNYSTSTIEMIIVERGSRPSLLPSGTYVRTDALGLTADVVEEGDEIKTSSNKYYEVKTVREIYTLGGDSFAYREVDLVHLPFENLSGASYTASSVEDARYRTKEYLETYLDDDALPNYIVAYGMPDYPLVRVFKTKGVDLVFSIGSPDTSPMMDAYTRSPYGYNENVHVSTECIDKTNVDGTKLFWQAESELRRVAESYPTGSLRVLTSHRPATQNLGSTVLYSGEYILNYRRDTT